MSRSLHDRGNGTFDADRLLLARVEALHAAVTESCDLAGLAMTASEAAALRAQVIYRAGVFERWLLRPDEDGPDYTIHEAG